MTTTTTNRPPETLLARLRQAGRLLVTSHQSPDGDAIGSEIALARLLRKMGKGIVIWNRDATPSMFRNLPGAERIHVGTEPPPGFPEGFDTVVVLECPSLERTGLAEALGNLRLLNIDHHLGNAQYGEVNWVDTAAPAVGELVHRLADALKIELDADTATILLMTIASDTGGFRFSNTTVAAFESAAALVRFGASPEQVGQWLYESQPEGAVRLLCEVLPTLAVSAEGRVATILLTPDMYTRANATPSDSEGLVDHPRSIAGVQAAALIRDLGDGRAKASLRSRGDLDVERLARQYGGGGHRNAAGFTTSRAAVELRSEVEAALAALVR